MNDRQLLAALNQWARTNGWKRGWTWRGWSDPGDTTVVRVDWQERLLRVWRKSGDQWPHRPTAYPVGSLRDVVDQLCLLGILPVEMSSLYKVAAEQFIEEIDVLNGRIAELSNQLAYADGSAERTAFHTAMEYLRA